MSRIVSFTAKAVGADDDDFALTVGFARDSADEQTDDGLVLQRVKEDEPDDQGIYAEVPIQRYASYGGIHQATLARDRFSITFAAQTVRDFAGISGMEISFVVSDADFERLASLLHRVFRNHAHFVVQNG